MQETLTRRATYADLEEVPPHLVAEILVGRLVTHPRPTGRHSSVHFRLGNVLGAIFEIGLGGPGGWRFLTEPELHMGGDVAVPELAGWRNEHIPGPPAPDPLERVKIRLAPDWVCEILSPSTEKYDRNEKREIYASAGVKHLWLVDPRIELLEVFALSTGRWTLVHTFANDDAVRVVPFEAGAFRLGRIWPPDRGPSASPTESE